MVLLIILLLLPGLLANNISTSLDTQPATSLQSSLPPKTTPPLIQPGSPVPSSEPETNKSSKISRAAISIPSPLTPSSIPQHCQEYPTWHTEFRDIEVQLSTEAGNDYLGQEFYEIRQTALTATSFSV